MSFEERNESFHSTTLLLFSSFEATGFPVFLLDEDDLLDDEVLDL